VLFAQFWQWLSDLLADYVSEHVAATAAAIEPAAVSLAVIYVMVWGYLHLKGSIEEPIIAGAMRIARLAVVFGVGLQLWQYNALLVDTFMEAPVELAAELAGAADPVGTIDALWEAGGTVAALLWQKGGVLNGEVGYYLAAAIVYLLMGSVCVYALFLMALARVALALLLAVGPVFIVLLLFDSTRRFFEGWIAQLANYGLVGVLAVLMAAMMLTVVETYAVQTAARGDAILTVDALDMLLVAGLGLLLLRQVMPIAARLGGGVALASFGVASNALARSARVGGAMGQRLGGGVAARLAERSWSPAVAGFQSLSSMSGVAGSSRVRPVWRGVRGT
jgi:type IV secretion system protein VirB6